jgi:hypothetical protein
MLFLFFNPKYHILSNYTDNLFVLNKNREEIIKEFKYFIKGGYTYFS